MAQGAHLSQQVHGEVTDGNVDSLHLLHVADKVIFAGPDCLGIVEEGVEVVDVLKQPTSPSVPTGLPL
jgi:hypothetical protein